jgi:transcriptional regulator with XRE-family HTH domain
MNGFRDREAADRQRKGLALKALRGRLGLSQTAAAEAAGFSSYKAWQNYENGDRNFSDPKLDKLLTALGASREAFDFELSRIPADEGDRGVSRGLSARARPFAAAYQLPSGGVAHGGALRPEINDEEAGEVIDLARYFANGTRILRLGGMSMYPYAESGGFVTYNPNHPPRRGQGCVIEMKDGSKLVKRFEHYDDETLTVTELWPEERQLKYPLADVAGVYAIGLRGE